MIEYDKYLVVQSADEASARRFFGVPADWPVEAGDAPDEWWVLSPAWGTQRDPGTERAK